jgi:hypothetical protein
VYAVSWQIDAEWDDIGAGKDVFINYDLYTEPTYGGLAILGTDIRKGTLSSFARTRNISSDNLDDITSMLPEGMSFDPNGMNEVFKAAFPPWDPQSSFSMAVYENYEPDSKPVGYVMGYIRWSKYFSTSLLKDGRGIYCVVSNSKGEVHTWLVQKSGVEHLGPVSASVKHCALSVVRCVLIVLHRIPYWHGCKKVCLCQLAHHLCMASG